MNTNRQFHVLYRQFLFRLMDAELLAASARGDANQLFGRFASLLVFVSLGFAWAAALYRGAHLPPAEAAALAWSAEHQMVEVTMLAVGIFAVFSWDSTFPDRRDVLVLAPLPVRGRTLFTAKIAAVATALGLAVALLNGLSGLAWPLALGSGIVGKLRFLAAFSITLPAAGAFLYCAILSVQGIVAQLPRRWFLRISSFLQIAVFGLFVCVLLMQPSLTTVKALGAAQNQRLLTWLPSYWFLGLLSELSGGFSGVGHAVMAPLAWRAVTGLAVAMLIAGAAFVLSYFRTLRKIAEEPDIAPGSRGGFWLSPFGNAPTTALAQFTVRTLARSRQHRMNLAFYLGVGFAVMTVSLSDATTAGRRAGIDVLAHPMNGPMVASGLLMLGVWVVGTRVAFSRPLDLRANWLFSLMPLRGVGVCLSATRRALLMLSVLPVLVGCAVFFLRLWPWQPVAQHLLLVGLTGSLLTDLCLTNFRKIPFTCSYLPGKSMVHVMVLAVIMLAPVVLEECVKLERWVMERPFTYWTAVALLGVAAYAVPRIMSKRADGSGEEIQFEEFESDEVVGLGLSR